MPTGEMSYQTRARTHVRAMTAYWILVTALNERYKSFERSVNNENSQLS